MDPETINLIATIYDMSARLGYTEEHLKTKNWEFNRALQKTHNFVQTYNMQENLIKSLLNKHILIPYDTTIECLPQHYNEVIEFIKNKYSQNVTNFYINLLNLTAGQRIDATLLYAGYDILTELSDWFGVYEIMLNPTIIPGLYDANN